MSSPEISVDANDAHASDDLIEVGVYSTFRDGSEHGLVILAMGLAYWLVPSNDRFALLVEPQGMTAVREQLEKFDRESVGWPPVPPGAGSGRPIDLVTPLLWALGTMAVFWSAQRWPNAIEDGALDGNAIFSRGEWWRLITALFLHADVSHLVTNIVAGIFVFGTVISAFGRRFGWLLLAASSVLGNLSSAAIRYPAPYLSIGASTAIFGGLGLLTGRAISIAHDSAHPHRWRGMLVPLGAGLTTLALFGAGEQRVDVGAHACGFGTGLLLGILAIYIRRSNRNATATQTAL